MGTKGSESMYELPIALAAVAPWLIKTGQFAVIIVGVGFLIFVHELGHFLVAKWQGVRVERFALGLGKKLIGFKRGETEYALCFIPFGGYVKMAGEYPDQEHTGADDEFYSKSPGRRALIVIAGVVMNAIVALLLFVVAFQFGVRLESPEITLIPGQAAWVAGLQEGDVVVEADGSRINNFGDLAHVVAVSEGEIILKLKRDGVIVTEKLTPEDNSRVGFRMIGVAPVATLTVAAVAAGGRGEEAGIRKGDVLVDANGEKLVSWGHFRRIVGKNPEKPIRLTLTRLIEGRESEVVVDAIPESEGGWELGCVSSNDLYMSRVRRGDPAWNGGVREGDLVVSLNGSPTGGLHGFTKAVSSSGGEIVGLGIKRDGDMIDVNVVPEYNFVEDRSFIGVMFQQESIVGGVEAGSPAERVGLEAGDRIVSVKLPDSDYKKEIEIGSWILFKDVINASKGKEVILSWKRGEKIFRERIVPRRNEELAMGFLGLGPQMKLNMVRLGFMPAVRIGMRNSYMWGKRILEILHGLFVSRKISFRALSGPVGIPAMGMHFVERGFGTFLYFLGMLGVNFAVINLLPLPIVDGSVLVLLGLEKARGKPLSIKVQAVIQQVGIVMLVAIFLLLTIQDVGRWF